MKIERGRKRIMLERKTKYRTREGGARKASEAEDAFFDSARAGT
jgi:hypothetical protein